MLITRSSNTSFCDSVFFNSSIKTCLIDSVAAIAGIATSILCFNSISDSTAIKLGSSVAAGVIVGASQSSDINGAFILAPLSICLGVINQTSNSLAAFVTAGAILGTSLRKKKGISSISFFNIFSPVSSSTIFSAAAATAIVAGAGAGIGLAVILGSVTTTTGFASSYLTKKSDALGFGFDALTKKISSFTKSIFGKAGKVFS